MGPPSQVGTFLNSLHNHLNTGDVTPIQEIDLDGETAQPFIWKSGQTVDVRPRSDHNRSHPLRKVAVSQASYSLVEASDGIIFVI